ncbi:type II secretion system protein N [Dyella soli]|uniref:Type II secretion system protein N n=1 Tax=Dyella soli TaxID=522319 RepID=A0A4R0YWI3_9GAMM|nr:type II secretion system protein N [Dyella soli]TCI10982.1 type II secretion system protein N [Dyella soli]
MKHWRTALVGLLALLLTGFALLWFLPASWAMPLLAPRLNGVRLSDVSGSLWDGAAGQVLSARNENLGRVNWQLSRLALLGEQRLRVDMHGPRLDFTGSMEGGSATEAVWTDVQMRADLGLFGAAASLPGGQARGTLAMTAGHVRLSGGWPLEMDASITWQPAAMRVPRLGELPLGTLLLTLHSSKGVVEGTLHDDGSGPLQVAGRLQLSPLGRRFTAEAKPREPNAGLQRWLSGLGTTDARGVTHINYSGGLAAALPEGKR